MAESALVDRWRASPNRGQGPRQVRAGRVRGRALQTLVRPGGPTRMRRPRSPKPSWPFDGKSVSAVASMQVTHRWVLLHFGQPIFGTYGLPFGEGCDPPWLVLNATWPPGGRRWLIRRRGYGERHMSEGQPRGFVLGWSGWGRRRSSDCLHRWVGCGRTPLAAAISAQAAQRQMVQEGRIQQAMEANYGTAHPGQQPLERRVESREPEPQR